MSFISRIIASAEDKLGLFQRMAKTVGVDPANVSPANDLMLAQAMQRCVACSHECECRAFLDEHEASGVSAASAPAYCPNQRLFEIEANLS